MFDHGVELGADSSHEVESDPDWATQRTRPGKISQVVELRNGFQLNICVCVIEWFSPINQQESPSTTRYVSPHGEPVLVEIEL